jgi:hypothetical protein
MTKRARVSRQRLQVAEEEFATLLRSCLEQCAAGRGNLFGHNDAFPENERWCSWPNARRLKGLAEEISSILADSGERNEDCDRLLQLCGIRGPNFPGEPTLAAEFLADIRSREISRGAGN